MTDKDEKDVLKQAIKEWMNERYAEVGRWAVKTILVAGLTLLVFKYIELRGYKFP